VIVKPGVNTNGPLLDYAYFSQFGSNYRNGSMP